MTKKKRKKEEKNEEKVTLNGPVSETISVEIILVIYFGEKN